MTDIQQILNKYQARIDNILTHIDTPHHSRDMIEMLMVDIFREGKEHQYCISVKRRLEEKC